MCIDEWVCANIWELVSLTNSMKSSRLTFFNLGWSDIVLIIMTLRLLRFIWVWTWIVSDLSSRNSPSHYPNQSWRIHPPTPPSHNHRNGIWFKEFYNVFSQVNVADVTVNGVNAILALGETWIKDRAGYQIDVINQNNRHNQAKIRCI